MARSYSARSSRSPLANPIVLPFNRFLFHFAHQLGIGELRSPSTPPTTLFGRVDGSHPVKREAAAVREDAPELKAMQTQNDSQNDTAHIDFVSSLNWTEDAINRLNIVPAGFMRNITQTRIEQRAQDAELTQVTLDFAARVIEDGRSLANEVLGEYYQGKQPENTE